MGKTSTCRDCGEEIAFEKNKNDRWAPVHPMTRAPHRCEIEVVCGTCQKTFKGSSWMSQCRDCYDSGGQARDPSPGAPSPSQPAEPLRGDLVDDPDAPPF